MRGAGGQLVGVAGVEPRGLSGVCPALPGAMVVVVGVAFRGLGQRGRRGAGAGPGLVHVVGHVVGLVGRVGALGRVRVLGLMGCPVRAVQTFLAAPFPYDPPAGHGPQNEHRQHDQHHQLADEEAPEQAVAGELGRGCVGPGGREVLWGRGQFAQSQGGSGEGDVVRPGAVGEEAGQAGGRPGEQGRREEEADQSEQQTVGDAPAGFLLAGAGPVGLVVAAPLRGRTLCCWSACHVRPPWTGTIRSAAAGSRSGPPAAPSPAPRRGGRREAGRPGPRPSPRSWRGR